MSRKSVLRPYNLIAAGDMASDITSSEINVINLDNVGLIVSWSGTSPVGILTIEVASGESVWSELSLGADIEITGNTGSHNINLNQIPHEKLRVVYTATSGTGELSVYITGKVVGA